MWQPPSRSLDRAIAKSRERSCSHGAIVFDWRNCCGANPTLRRAFYIIVSMHAIAHTRESLVELLRQRGVSPTHQRIEIATVLFGRQQHLSADQVLMLVNEGHPETSRATVYNTLKLFVDKKLAREVIVDPSRVFYDPNVKPHFHLYDVESGRLTDIDSSSVTITGLPALPENMMTEGMDVIIRVRRIDS